MQNNSNSSRQYLFSASILVTVVVASLSLAGDDVSGPTTGGQRLREGTQLIEVTGKLEAVGDRANFVFADSGESVQILENLALQRVTRVLPQLQPGTQWTVSGVITEYNARNFLLMTKAVQATKPAARESAAASGIGTRETVGYSKSNHQKSGETNQPSTNDSHP